MKKFDIAVIGAGPAGMLAAGRAAELGARVILIEKNDALGVKLLMTGGGRCNFTNNSSIKDFSASLGLNGRWLISVLNTFGPEDIINFFENRGVSAKTEENNRVFPVSNSARDILQALLDYSKEGGVEIMTNSEIVKVVSENNIISKLILASGQEILADKFIFACGGKSYPGSGSSGEVYQWLQSLGHNIVEVKPALSQLFIKEDCGGLEGLSFCDILISAKNIEFKSNKIRGDLMFTKKGLSGPAALNLSRELIRQNNQLELSLDFFPDKNEIELENEIRELIENNKNFSIKNVLSLLIPKRFSAFLIMKAKIDITKKSTSLSKTERKIIINILKNSKFTLAGVGDFSEAMISSGGVNLKEVDQKTMASKIIPNLYLIGETLDLDGPTGGYNLQIAWTTAYLAGSSCV